MSCTSDVRPITAVTYEQQNNISLMVLNHCELDISSPVFFLLVSQIALYVSVVHIPQISH